MNRPSGGGKKPQGMTGALLEAVGKTGPLIRSALGETLGKVPMTGPLLRDAVVAAPGKDRTEARNIRVFILIWFGQLISLIGSGLTGFGLGVWVYQRTGSASQFTLISVFVVLPNIIFLPIAGALVDRWDRREMMIFSTAGAGLSSLLVVFLLFAGYLEIWHIYVTTIIRSLFNTLQIPAYSSLPTLLVPKKHLARASGMVQAAQAAAMIISPFLAGVAIASVGLKGVVLIDFGTYLFAIVTLMMVEVPRPKKAVGTGVLMLEAVSKVKKGTGMLMRDAVNKATGGTGRLNTATLGKTGTLLRSAVGQTGMLLREAISNAEIDEKKSDFQNFSSTNVLAGTGPLIQETVGVSKKAKPTLLRESIYGWTFIKERPGLLVMLLTFAAINFTVGMAQVLFTPLILSFNSPQVLSKIISCAGLGLLIGSALMSIWGGPKYRIIGALSAAALVGISVMIVGLRPSTVLITVGVFGMLFASPILNGCTQAIWQTKTPANVQGRVFAVRRMIAQCTSPIAFLLAGPLADKVFEPLMAVNGPLSGSVGRILGQGPGRGIGFLFVISGILAVLISITSYFYPRLRMVEQELKDAV